MLAERAYAMCADAEIHVSRLSPRRWPSSAPRPPRRSRSCWPTPRSRSTRASKPEIVARGPRATGAATAPRSRSTGSSRCRASRDPPSRACPPTPEGFLVTDPHARVSGVADVYAAGDVTAFPIKQGGIACQQADAAAADIAARAGAAITPEPFAPVLRGMLLTERSAHFMRHEGDADQVAGRALWWPPTKIAGRELAGYLEGLDDSAGRPSGLPVNVAVGDTGSDEIEVLSLH